MTIRTYYNLLWNTHGNKEAILALLIALDNSGFHYRARVEEFLDDSAQLLAESCYVFGFFTQKL
jgi:hypothetical protein